MTYKLTLTDGEVWEGEIGSGDPKDPESVEDFELGTAILADMIVSAELDGQPYTV